MTDWIDQLVQDTKKRYEDQRSTDERLVKEEHLKKAASKVFIQELISELQNACAEFNTKIGGVNVLAVQQQDTELTIHAQLTREQTKSALVSYFEPSFQLTVSMPDQVSQDYYHLVLSSDDSVVAEMGRDGRNGGTRPQFNPQKFSQLLLSQLLTDRRIYR